MPEAPPPAATALPPTAPRGMRENLLVPMLGALLGVQPVTTDLYLPALPALTSGLGAGMVQAQLTLTALLLAFGLSQLLWGPLSDRFGRRRILLTGLATYALAGLGGALAPSMDVLIVWRVLQGIGMGAAVMGARAVLRDLYAPADGARMMARALGLLGVLACLSPAVGGLVAEFAHWRVALLVPALFGAATLAGIALRYEETLREPNPHALRPRALLATWWQIVRHPTFIAWGITSGASYGGLFTFLATSSFIFTGLLGVGRPAYGAMMASCSVFYILGTVLCRRLLRRVGLRRTVALAAILTAASGTALGLMAWSDAITRPWHVLLPVYLFMLGHGVHQPCGQAGAVGPFPQAAGTASALNGFAMMLVAFGMGTWLGTHMDGSANPLALGMAFWCACIVVGAWTLVQRHGEVRPTTTTRPATADAR